MGVVATSLNDSPWTVHPRGFVRPPQVLAPFLTLGTLKLSLPPALFKLLELLLVRGWLRGLPGRGRILARRLTRGKLALKALLGGVQALTLSR